MQRIKLSIILISTSLSLSSCKTLPGAPDKPNVEICIINYPKGTAYCGMTSKLDIQSAKDLKYDVILTANYVNGYEKPIDQLDKSICQNPENWKLTQDYIDRLENYIGHQCKQEIDLK